MGQRERDARKLALLLVTNCMRNTYLEDLHAGVFPSSVTGDYSDVKVVSPYGEIAWNDLGRISDEEMKRLMMECVDRVYTVMVAEDTMLAPASSKWRRPRLWKPMLRRFLPERPQARRIATATPDESG